MGIEQPLILASSSPHRKALLKKLLVPFTCEAPEVNEAQIAGESPRRLVERLAQRKAEAVAHNNPHAIIIGSDQVALCNGQCLGKPGTHSLARQQLEDLSGNRVTFLTGLCLLNARSGALHLAVEFCRVKFRSLTVDEIEDYLRRDEPYQCAGAFKSEGLGVALLESIETNDPNILVGLPLIRLVEFLAQEGCSVLRRGTQ